MGDKSTWAWNGVERNAMDWRMERRVFRHGARETVCSSDPDAVYGYPAVNVTPKTAWNTLCSTGRDESWRFANPPMCSVWMIEFLYPANHESAYVVTGNRNKFGSEHLSNAAQAVETRPPSVTGKYFDRNVRKTFSSCRANFRSANLCPNQFYWFRLRAN